MAAPAKERADPCAATAGSLPSGTAVGGCGAAELRTGGGRRGEGEGGRGESNKQTKKTNKKKKKREENNNIKR